MRIELATGETTLVVEVDLAGGTARIGDRSVPIRIVRDEEERIELEIAGESFLLEDWPQGHERPGANFSVAGERTEIVRLVRAGSVPSASPRAANGPGGPPGPAPPPSGAGEVEVRPPMPGRLLEVRVAPGASVAAGEVLGVLEAMKMRNEIVSPVAGTVRSVGAAAGANVRVRDVLFRIAPN